MSSFWLKSSSCLAAWSANIVITAGIELCGDRGVLVRPFRGSNYPTGQSHDLNKFLIYKNLIHAKPKFSTQERQYGYDGDAGHRTIVQAIFFFQNAHIVGLLLM